MTALTPGEAGAPETDALDTKLSEAIWAESRGPGWDDYNEWMGLARRLERERDALRGALERLGSMKAIALGGIVDPMRDVELLARIDFARTSLKAKEQGL
mgnify:CR=1 FL=1